MYKDLLNPEALITNESNESNVSAAGDENKLLADVLARPVGHTQHASKSTTAKIKKIDGIVIGMITSSEPVLVDYPSNPAQKSLPAISTRSIDKNCVNRKAALAFEGGNPDKPIILGLIEEPEADALAESEFADKEKNIHVKADGECMTISAEREIVLKCGKSSITLTKEGKVLIRGKYLLSRSAGVNRIKGGSVQIN